MADFTVEFPDVKIPGFKRFPKSFWDEVGLIAAGSIIENILTGKKAKGGRFFGNIKRNPKGYRLLKQRLYPRSGGRSLIAAKERFVKGSQTASGRTRRNRSWKIINRIGRGQGIEIGPANEELAELSRSVQKKGYVGWMGINKDAAAAIVAEIAKAVKQAFEKAQKGNDPTR